VSVSGRPFQPSLMFLGKAPVLLASYARKAWQGQTLQLMTNISKLRT
jgi:hypothetical protein